MKRIIEGLGTLAFLAGAVAAAGSEGKTFWVMVLVTAVGAATIGGCVLHEELTKEDHYTELHRDDTRLYFLH